MCRTLSFSYSHDKNKTQIRVVVKMNVRRVNIKVQLSSDLLTQYLQQNVAEVM